MSNLSNTVLQKDVTRIFPWTDRTKRGERETNRFEMALQ